MDSHLKNVKAYENSSDGWRRYSVNKMRGRGRGAAGNPNDHLDREILFEELLNIVSKSKNGNSQGIDQLSVELFRTNALIYHHGQKKVTAVAQCTETWRKITVQTSIQKCQKPPVVKLHQRSSPGSCQKHSCTPHKAVTPKRKTNSITISNETFTGNFNIK
ncbi:unnamed protein product [Mytilus edulis]|uniref:Uncharacterized protein n=1 Tax=Mytilus edulis TaxID=6550 RepID=A0A8S3Q828_MYTED|nr:unnamed protein product [Mytilus edulis]